MASHFTLRLNVDDEQNPDITLRSLVDEASNIRRLLNLQTVTFDYCGVGYSVTRNAVIQTIKSSTYAVIPPEVIDRMSNLTVSKI